MRKESKQTSFFVTPAGVIESLRAANGWCHLPTVAKCIIIVPVAMVLLGTEIHLRLAPQLDVILTVAGVCLIWAWLTGTMLPPA